MSEGHVCDTKDIFLQIGNRVRFRIIRIKEIEKFFNAKISVREKLSKTLKKYILAIYCADNNLIVLSGASNGISICAFITVISAPVGMASASIILVFLSVMGSSKCS